jgi:hypothetical protein
VGLGIGRGIDRVGWVGVIAVWEEGNLLRKARGSAGWKLSWHSQAVNIL